MIYLNFQCEPHSQEKNWQQLACFGQVLPGDIYCVEAPTRIISKNISYTQLRE